LEIFSTAKGRILSWYETPDLIEVEIEIVLFRVSTTDGFLVSQAVGAGCKYYVTEDKDLRDRLARHRHIEPISAQAMLDELKKTPCPADATSLTGASVRGARSVWSQRCMPRSLSQLLFQ
jgi:hypothetical protein